MKLRYNRPNSSSSNLINTDQLNWGTVTPQQVITGRTGELVAFQYFAEIYGVKSVKWVNEVKESGLPFDIIIEGENNSKEYIEVKSTSHANKDWFVISVKEWQFAVEQGGSFTIARVLVSHGNLVRITTYRNPVKLCKSRHLQLAILSSQ
ncbi:histidine kinase-, DNA gyrase B-, and HSP90-like ATPase family protein [Tanacetum coccineum]|uniref:Histidine kinase-, DNA gyrase B-, and HSP90-like ATPase family protein n=1 Tax=Tanacetum coccineum TaxID=301880 RepID=A0ABQ5DG74_9ASTR